MSRHRGASDTLIGSVILAVSTTALAGQAPAQLPLDPVRDTGQSVIGAYEGWYQNPDGSYSLLVGYFNRNQKETLDIPLGPNNRIEPGGPDMGQPTHFLPRRQWGVFVVKVPKDFGKSTLTWTLVANGQTTVIPLNLDPLWIVAPFKDAALGNTPPSIGFEAEGERHQGPPVAISRSYATTTSQPLALSVWVNDDGVRAPEARERPLTPTVTWSKFRGPGNVTFDKAQPKVDEKTGNATTIATFTTAGEYILRVQVNDVTGEGGGGFQCCWTNAHVKVVVGSSQ
jgi:hypothetical protein